LGLLRHCPFQGEETVASKPIYISDLFDHGSIDATPVKALKSEGIIIRDDDEELFHEEGSNGSN
jgi:hypothetical protein